MGGFLLCIIHVIALQFISFQNTSLYFVSLSLYHLIMRLFVNILAQIVKMLSNNAFYL